MTHTTDVLDPIIQIINVSDLPNRKVLVGHYGENEFRRIIFDITDWRKEFPDGSPIIVFKRADGRVYSVNVTINEDSNPVFTPSSIETSVVGDCIIQLRWTENNVLGKTCDIFAYVDSAIGSVGELPDDTARDWEAEITRNTTARHTHNNKSLLDTYRQSEDNIADAVIKKHTHPNKNELDSISSTDIAAWNDKIDRNEVEAIINASVRAAVLAAHPIGSYYWSDDSTNPAKLFGGEWERVKGVFLFAADDTYPAGAEGGEPEHTLTKDEMPRHIHGAYYTNSGTEAPTHAWYTVAGNDMTYQAVATGGDQPHNNMPPYYATYLWRRIG